MVVNWAVNAQGLVVRPSFGGVISIAINPGAQQRVSP